MTTSDKARRHQLGIRLLYGGAKIPEERWVPQVMRRCGCTIYRPEGTEPIKVCPAHARHLREVVKP